MVSSEVMANNMPLGALRVTSKTKGCQKVLKWPKEPIVPNIKYLLKNFYILSF